MWINKKLEIVGFKAQNWWKKVSVISQHVVKIWVVSILCDSGSGSAIWESSGVYQECRARNQNLIIWALLLAQADGAGFLRQDSTHPWLREEWLQLRACTTTCLWLRTGKTGYKVIQLAAHMNWATRSCYHWLTGVVHFSIFRCFISQTASMCY